MAIQVEKLFKIEIETAAPMDEAQEPIDVEEEGGVPKASVLKLALLLDIQSGEVTVNRSCKNNQDCKGCCGAVRTALMELKEQGTEHPDLNDALNRWDKDNDGGIVAAVAADGKCVGDRCRCRILF